MESERERGGVLLATEAISVARRPEEREKDSGREKRRRECGEREGRNFPPASPRDGISVARERARERGEMDEEGEKDFSQWKELPS